MSNLSEFITSAIDHMARNGVTTSFVAKPRYQHSTGVFCFPTLHVATDRKDWEETFIHEYCHFLQHLDEQRGIFINYPNMTYQSYEDWWAWINHKEEFPKSKIKRIRRGLQKMERDCDRRAVAMIRKYKLELDAKAYAQRANSYQLLYTLIEKHRKWYVHPPYESKGIVGMMPDKLMRSYEKLPEGYEEMVVNFCFAR